MRSLFRDNEGRLRLGWRVALYLIGFVVIAAISGAVAYFLRRAEMARELADAVGGLLQVTGILVFTRLIRRYLDRRPWSGIALPPASRGLGQAAVGFVIGIVLQLIVFGIERGLGWVSLLPTAASVATVLMGVSASLVFFVAVGFTEELVMRGYLLQNFAEAFPLWQATCAVGLIFGVAHALSGSIDVWFVLGAVLLTVSFVVVRVVTGSLWLAIGWHAAWDWMQHSLLGLDVTRGSDFDSSWLHVRQSGPPLWVGTAPHIEGGLLFSAVDALALVALLIWARSRGARIPWSAQLGPDGTPR